MVARRTRTPRRGPLLPGRTRSSDLGARSRRARQSPAPTFDKRIYDAPPAALLTVVRELHPDAATALLIGHNPGLQELVALLSRQELDMKTSSVAVLKWKGRWTDAAPEIAHLRQHMTPRG